MPRPEVSALVSDVITVMARNSASFAVVDTAQGDDGKGTGGEN